MFKKGFTLIELMVVISIISLFSSIAFASFATTRVKAQEATIKSDLKNIKSQAEISFNNVGNYSTASSEAAPIIEGINKAGGTAVFYVSSDNAHYAVSAKLNSNPSKNWSVSDQADVVKWDTVDKQIQNWNLATIACSNIGGRLPSTEELMSLFNTYGNVPPSFTQDWYWTITPLITQPTYIQTVYAATYGGFTSDVSGYSKNYQYVRVRCVF